MRLPLGTDAWKKKLPVVAFSIQMFQPRPPEGIWGNVMVTVPTLEPVIAVPPVATALGADSPPPPIAVSITL